MGCVVHPNTAEVTFECVGENPDTVFDPYYIQGRVHYPHWNGLPAFGDPDVKAQEYGSTEPAGLEVVRRMIESAISTGSEA